MIRIHLPPEEVDHLGSVLQTTPDSKLRTRVQIVLMAHRGRPCGLIACETHLPQFRPKLAQRLLGTGARRPLASQARRVPRYRPRSCSFSLSSSPLTNRI